MPFREENESLRAQVARLEERVAELDEARRAHAESVRRKRLRALGATLVATVAMTVVSSVAGHTAGTIKADGREAAKAQRIAASHEQDHERSEAQVRACEQARAEVDDENASCARELEMLRWSRADSPARPSPGGLR